MFKASSSFIFMCMGYDPLTRAMPYFVSGIIPLIFLIFLYNKSVAKRFDKKTLKPTKASLIIIAIILFTLAILEQSVIYRAGC